MKDIAQVSINGQPMKALWKPPYKADITSALKTGPNRLEIRITNQWTNRQIGDRLAAPEKRILSPSFGGMGAFGGAQTLTDAELLGPVTVISVLRSERFKPH